MLELSSFSQHYNSRPVEREKDTEIITQMYDVYLKQFRIVFAELSSLGISEVGFNVTLIGHPIAALNLTHP